MGSLLLVHFPNLKFFVVCPLMMHAVWLFNSVCIHFMNSLPSPYLFKARLMIKQVKSFLNVNSSTVVSLMLALQRFAKHLK